MIFRLSTILITCLFISVTQYSFAQENIENRIKNIADTEEQEIEDMVITATRSEVAREEVPASVQLISSTDIETTTDKNLTSYHSFFVAS